MSANPVALTVFLVLFFATAGLGFYATKMRSVNVSDLAQWGLGGRSFGTAFRSVRPALWTFGFPDTRGSSRPRSSTRP